MINYTAECGNYIHSQINEAMGWVGGKKLKSLSCHNEAVYVVMPWITEEPHV